jgi:diacylglycerol diphosphate phosphatase/phosphatidate phosphatase
LGILQDGFRSFFSGHSSCALTPIPLFFEINSHVLTAVSFAGLGFLSYYLAGKLHLFDKRGHTVNLYFKV